MQNFRKYWRIYALTMLVFPLFSIVFFTSLLNDGQPMNLPIAVVDQDNSSTTRTLVQRLSAFQSTKVAAHYASIPEAREAMQRGDIYGFIVFPEGFNEKLLASRQPTVTFYYNTAFFTAGSLAFKDLKTISVLGKAAVVQSKLQAQGVPEKQIETILQPVKPELHGIGNPWTNYNVYLSTMIVPGIIMLLITMTCVYSLGSELRDGTAKALLERNRRNIWALLAKKILPQTAIYILLMCGFQAYIYGPLGFPHEASWDKIMLLGVQAVLTAQGFAIFIFGLMPHLRLALSVCSLWGVLNFSMSGTGFPIDYMDPILQAMAYLFPLRHYFMTYQLGIFHGYGLEYTYIWVGGMILFAMLPLLNVWHIKKAYLEYQYEE